MESLQRDFSFPAHAAGSFNVGDANANNRNRLGCIFLCNLAGTATTCLVQDGGNLHFTIPVPANSSVMFAPPSGVVYKGQLTLNPAATLDIFVGMNV